jgi:DsbC/DsbD-like thiol-disulfide interchange protein
VELEQSRQGFEKQGVKIAAVTYDSKEILRRFSAAHHLDYPLLSDQGSVVIREFGILNTNVPKDHPFYGIPFPGDYLISPDGVIKAKYFLQDYQTRVASSEILLSEFDAEVNAPSMSLTAGDIRIVITPSTSHAVAGQEIGVAAQFTIAKGWHIYGQPLPANYTPTTIVFDSDCVAQQSFEYPDPDKVPFPQLGETLPVYAGNFLAKGKILARPGLKPGDYKLKGKLTFQECSEQICKIPQSVTFEIPFRIDPMASAAP